MTPEQQANELMTLLEQFINFKFDGLSDFTLSCSPSVIGSRPSRTGLSNTDGLCDSGYKHFFFFVQGWILYFSTKTLIVRFEEEYEAGTDEVFKGSIDDFLSEYFQLSTQYDLLSKELFIRIKNFMSTYNWARVYEK